MLVIEAESVLRRVAIAGDKSSFVIDKSVFENMIQQQQSLLGEGFIFCIFCEAIEFIRPADGVGRPAGPFKIAKIVPVHYLAVLVHKARFAGQLSLKRNESALSKTHGVPR